MRHFAFGDRETLPDAPVSGSFKDHTTLQTFWAQSSIKWKAWGFPGSSVINSKGKRQLVVEHIMEKEERTSDAVLPGLRPHSSSVFLAR